MSSSEPPQPAEQAAPTQKTMQQLMTESPTRTLAEIDAENNDHLEEITRKGEEDDRRQNESKEQIVKPVPKPFTQAAVDRQR